MTQPDEQGVRFPWRTAIVVGVVALAIILPFVFAGAQVDAWVRKVIAQAEQNRVLAGCLLAGLLATDILMPVPSSLVSTACGMALGFWGGTLASFAGMSITTAVGYLMGRYAAAPVGRLIGAAEFAMLERFHRRHGIWLLLALRPVPVLAETSVVFSGVARLPVTQVAAVTMVGNAAVSAVYAAIGVWGACSDSFIPAFLVAMVLSGVMMAVMRKRTANASAEQPQRSRSATEMREDHAFLVKRGAVSRERGCPRPQQRVLQKADAHTSIGNQTAHRNHKRSLTERAGTPALPTADTQNTHLTRMPSVTNRLQPQQGDQNHGT